MFQDVRKANYWFIAYIVGVIILLVFDKHFIQFADVPLTFNELSVSHGDFIFNVGLTIIVLSIIIFVSMRYFVNAFQKNQSEVERLVVELTETNSELETTLSELKTTQIELVQSEKMASLGKLAAGIAHELNNPIGALKSAASTATNCVDKIERLLEDNEEYAVIKNESKFMNVFQILKDNNNVFTSVSDRVSNTVNSFIKFARLDKARFDTVNIHSCIDDTLTLIQGNLKPRTNLRREYGEIPKIACYPGELNQVFVTLLTNAAEAIEEDGTITISTYVENNKIHVQIADDGIGIPEDQLQGLFDPGFTKNGTRVKTRMGLLTSHIIVQKHRGEIKVKSAVGKGSTFTITLPIDLENH